VSEASQRLYSSWETLNLESETLIASTDHTSMMFKPAPESLGKTPSGKKKSKERGPKSKPKEPNPKCITKWSWNNHVSEPPPIARSISERERNGKEWYYLFVSLQKWNKATPFKT
jgi:hypothetical protein